MSEESTEESNSADNDLDPDSRSKKLDRMSQARFLSPPFHQLRSNNFQPLTRTSQDENPQIPKPMAVVSSSAMYKSRSHKSQSVFCNGSNPIQSYQISVQNVRHYQDNGNVTYSSSKEFKAWSKEICNALKWKPHKKRTGSSTLLIVNTSEINPSLDSTTIEELHARLKAKLEQEEANAVTGDVEVVGSGRVDFSEKRFHLAWTMSQFYTRNKKEPAVTSIPLEGTADHTDKDTLRRRLCRLFRSSRFCPCMTRNQNQNINPNPT